MKVLLVSNVPEGLDKVVSLLDTEGATVVTKEINASAKEMTKQAYDVFAKGNFDMMIVLTDNSVAANIAFNKLEGTNAVVCETVDDASLAKENDANVIIIKNPDNENIPEILDVVAKKGKFRIGSLKQAKIFKPQKQQPAEKAEEESGLEKPKMRPQKLPEQQQMQKTQPKEDTFLTGPKRSGVFGWLKDELGIIDADKPAKQQPQQQPVKQQTPKQKQKQDKEQASQ